MTPLTIKLRHSARTTRSASAVLLPGDDVAQWLDWMLPVLGANSDSARLLPLTHRQDRQLLGAIFLTRESLRLAPRAAESSPWDQFDRRCSRYACIAGRLLLPVEAQLDPPVSDNEWSSLLPPDDSLLVWHPRAGLLRFESGQILHIPDLLVRPQRRAVNWDQAQPGTALNRRLSSILVEVPPSLQGILQSGQEDIGSESDQMRNLPKTGDEPAIDWRKIAAAPLSPLSDLANWVRGLLPAGGASTGGNQSGSGGAGGLLGGLGDSLMSGLGSMLDYFAALTPKLLQEREREIERLLAKLRNDPDEGLKYALPVADRLGRGVAAPSSRLGTHNVDFSLNPRHSGGPADYWNMPAEQQLRLVASYRVAAAREVRLGRFRRAAYIYASLLADFQAAANVLEQGRFYREAAAVYTEKLGRPTDAARCLEHGGLLEEAIAIYNVLGHHLKVGELYERLELRDEARAAYLREVGDRLQRHDRLGAADIFETRLADNDEALRVLEEGWPTSAQASKCLEKFFSMASKLQLHPRSLAKVEQLRSQVLTERQQSDLVTVLAEVTGTYGDAKIIQRTADTARVVAAEILQRAPDSPRILNAIADLAPEDRLLKRDCLRFRRELPSPPPTKRPFDKKPSLQGKLLRQLLIPGDWVWLHAESRGDQLYLVGHDGHQDLQLYRTGWSKQAGQSFVKWKGPGVGVGDLSKPLLMQVDDQTPATIHIGRWDCPPLPPRELGPTDDLPFPMTAATPRWLHRFSIVMGGHHLSSYTCDLHGLFRQYDRQGNIVAEHQLIPSEEPLDGRPVPVMHVRPREVFVGFRSDLYRIRDGEEPERYEMPGWITGIAGSPQHARSRIVVTHQNGASVFSPTLQDWNETALETATDLLGCVLNDGRIVLWCPEGDGNGTLKLYSLIDSRVVFHGATPRASSVPDHQIRILRPAREGNEVALIPTSSRFPIEVWGFAHW